MGLLILSGVFGINGNEFLVIILVAVIVVGPQRLPEYTRKLTQLVRQLRVFLDNARSQIAEEVGPEMADLDLSSLDPRQYDPRKIVRDALGEDIDAIREDLAHPFRTVGSAAKEMSDDAAQAVNDVVKKDRASSLSKQIEAKRDERLAEKVEDSENTKSSESTEGVENAESPQSAEQAAAAPPRGVLQQADDVEDDAETETEPGSVESVESTDGADETEPEKTEPEQSGEAEVAEDAEGTEQPEQSERPAEPVEVPTSLVEPQAAAAGEDAGDATAAGDDSHNRVRPLSPRDIVRAANAAARTRAEAARIAVDF